MQVVDAGTQPNWREGTDNVDYTVLQQPMPIDMRPITFPYVQLDSYNAFNVIWDEWSYYSGQLKEEDTWLYDEGGNRTTQLAVKYFCDPDVIVNYNRSKTRTQNNVTDIPVEMVPVSDFKGTGLRFFSTEGNLQAMMDATEGETFMEKAPRYMDEIAGTLNFGHEMHAFVTVNNFRSVGIPYDHPFFLKLANHEPDADTIACIPCEDKQVAACQINGATFESQLMPNFSLELVEGEHVDVYKIVLADTTTGINTAKGLSMSFTGTFSNGADKVFEINQSGGSVEIPFHSTAMNGLVGNITLTVTNGSQTKSITKQVGPSTSDLFIDIFMPEFTAKVSASGTKLEIMDESDFGLDAITTVVYKIEDGAGNSEILVESADADGYFHVAESDITAIGGGSLTAASTYTIKAAYQTAQDVAEGESALTNSILDARYFYIATANADGDFDSVERS